MAQDLARMSFEIIPLSQPPTYLPDLTKWCSSCMNSDGGNMSVGTSILALTVILASTAFAASGRNLKIAPDLEQADGAVDVIVQFNTHPTEAHHEKIRRSGGHLLRTVDGFRGAKYRLNSKGLEQLAADPSVVYITPDRAVSASADYVTPEANADIAQSYGFNGAGIGIAMIDSGVYDKHPDLQGRIVYQQAFDGSSWTQDKYGHGTHVAGLALGSGAASTGPGF